MPKRNVVICFIGLMLNAVVVMKLPGCSRRDGRLAVSGAVSIDGKPLETGSIRFQPVDLNKATGSGAIVRDGKYSVPAEHGLTPGKYAVTVQASEKTGRMIPDPQKQKGQVEEYREIRYQEAGKLDITLDPQASTRFDFPLNRATGPMPAQLAGSRLNDFSRFREGEAPAEPCQDAGLPVSRAARQEPRPPGITQHYLAWGKLAACPTNSTLPRQGRCGLCLVGQRGEPVVEDEHPVAADEVGVRLVDDEIVADLPTAFFRKSGSAKGLLFFAPEL